MAGQSDPHLSILSTSEVARFIPPSSPDSCLDVLGYTQVEFVAEDEVVEIVPNIRMDALNNLCACISPHSHLCF